MIRNADEQTIKKRSLSKIGTKQKQVTLPPDPEGMKVINENMKLLETCRNDWEGLRDFRRRRKRNRKYYRGDQWSDYVKDPDSAEGNLITEETYLKKQGKVPLKQNQIRQLVKNLIGQYRSNPSKAVVIARDRDDAKISEMFTNALQAAEQINRVQTLDARAFEEFSLSGAPVQKLSYRYWKERNQPELYIQNVNINRVFFNGDVADVRLTDLRRIGEIIDTTLDDVVATFAKSKAEEERIRKLYRTVVNEDFLYQRGLDPVKMDNLDFYIPTDPSKCRIIEVWELKGEWRTEAHDLMDGSYAVVPETLKEIAVMNRQRLEFGRSVGMPDEEIALIEAEEKFVQSWYVKFLTPYGQVLFESETPYSHESHPYALTLYPLLDGEVWGFVEDIIDQQRYINRLIILMDFIISASAKGVLMVPEDVIPAGMTPKEFADEWTRFNGVIIYKPNQSLTKPEQISSNSTNIGIHEMLALQMQLITQISGVHEAMQGSQAKSGTPAALYAQEAQNASLNTMDYIQTFNHFIQDRDTKALKIILQFYKEPRFLAVSGKGYAQEAKIWDPKKAIDVDFELVVTSGSDTPVFRSMIDQTLLEMLQGQLIDLEMYLENTTLPFADNLLESIRAKRQAAQQGQVAPVGADDPLAIQAAKGNPDIVSKFAVAPDGGGAGGGGKYDNL
jgi:hypothetical protein